MDVEKERRADGSVEKENHKSWQCFVSAPYRAKQSWQCALSTLLSSGSSFGKVFMR